MGDVAWGIDFGSRATRIVQVRREQNKVIIERVVVVEDRHNLRKALSAAGVVVREGIVGLSGKDCMLRLIKVPQAPPKRLSVILDFEIGELTKRSPEPTCGAYHISAAGEGGADQLLATVALVREKTTEQIYQELRNAGVVCHAFLPTPFALYNTFMALKNYDPSGLTVLIDIGVQTTTLVVVKDGAFVLGRIIPVGAQEFCKALASALSITPQQAEDVLLREAAIRAKNWRSEREKSISDALSGVVDRILLGVRSALNTAQRHLRLGRATPDRVLLFGGCARLPGLADMVSASLGTKAEAAAVLPPPSSQFPDTDPRPGLYEQVPARDAHNISPPGSELAVAVGLALSALGPPFLKLDLLPPLLRRKIEFRERYVWLIAAAALVVAFVILAALAVRREEGSTLRRNIALKHQREQLERRRSALAAKRRELKRLRSILKQLQQMPSVNKGVVKLLAQLHSPKLLPPSINLTSISLLDAKSDQEDRAKVLYLNGMVNAEVGEEMTIVRRFAKALSRLPYVENASVDPEATKRQKGRFVFRIGISFTEEAR
ncbi:MAG: hypothetical protein DRP82_00860 [Planctomycetota bacterium]|nr:MAG: hypothetical protein DRP82_00860 [Planctomycetota bacterium]